MENLIHYALNLRHHHPQLQDFIDQNSEPFRPDIRFAPRGWKGKISYFMWFQLAEAAVLNCMAWIILTEYHRYIPLDEDNDEPNATMNANGADASSIAGDSVFLRSSNATVYDCQTDTPLVRNDQIEAKPFWMIRLMSLAGICFILLITALPLHAGLYCQLRKIVEFHSGRPYKLDFAFTVYSQVLPTYVGFSRVMECTHHDGQDARVQNLHGETDVIQVVLNVIWILALFFILLTSIGCLYCYVRNGVQSEGSLAWWGCIYLLLLPLDAAGFVGMVYTTFFAQEWHLVWDFRRDDLTLPSALRLLAWVDVLSSLLLQVWLRCCSGRRGLTPEQWEANKADRQFTEAADVPSLANINNESKDTADNVIKGTV